MTGGEVALTAKAQIPGPLTDLSAKKHIYGFNS